MRVRQVVALALLVWSVQGKGVTAASTVELVTGLEKAEPFGALLFHKGYLWVGHSRLPSEHPYILEAYAEDGTKRVAQLKLPHSVRFLYPFGENELLVVGTSYQDGPGYQTHYSKVSVGSSGIRVTRTYTFPLQYQVDQFGGNPDAMFFGHPGDREVVRLRGGAPRKLAPELYGPGPMVLLGNSLFVVERNDPGSSNLAKVDLRTEKVERVFPKLRQTLNHPTWLSGLNRLAVSEFRADNLLLVNPNDLGDVRTVTVPGTPRAMEVVGNCLAVVLQTARKIVFLDLAHKDLRAVEEWDIASGGERLSNPIYLAANPSTGTLFVRSIMPCVLCEKSQAGVARVRGASGQLPAACRR